MISSACGIGEIAAQGGKSGADIEVLKGCDFIQVDNLERGGVSEVKHQ